MKWQIILTEDASHTIALPGTAITYHSKHGAIQESRHVFIEAGLKPFLHTGEMIRIFEMGFGTGLNTLLSLQTALLNKQPVEYVTAELYPLTENEYNLLNYCDVLGDNNLQPYFIAMHNALWQQRVSIHPLFTLTKIMQPVESAKITGGFDIIFYDAFAPNDQPELWTEKIFEKMFAMLKNKGILVTYCSKGAVQRLLAAMGFIVEKLPGPPGKREITRAKKNI
jgi:tRNA U34 5-methylaminomethyl-2-thiouridine-forming methyltransferase MnmC